MNEVIQTSTDPGRHVIDPPKPLSKSLLWQLQRTFYEAQGVEAWRTHHVPYHVTTNPYLASAYAKIVFGWLRDWQDQLDPSQPVYITELGCGSGRLAYHFLKRFFKLLDHSALKHIRVTYIMTDLAERNIEFWRNHPSLAPYIQAGRVDFARFDAESDDTVRLTESGAVLTRETVNNPMIVVANYFFDTVGTDAFHIKQGKLNETLIALTTAEKVADKNDPAVLEQVQIAYQDDPISVDHYDDPAINDILRYYEQRLGDTVIVFPITMLRMIQRLRAISNDRLMLLVTDKGFTDEESLLHRETVGMALHGGSFSVMVNFHAATLFTTNAGGFVLNTPHRFTSPSVYALCFGSTPADFVETRQAYQGAIAELGPEDLFAVQIVIGHHFESMILEQLLAYLRVASWDPAIFAGMFPALYSKLNDVGEARRQELFQAAREVWDIYFHLGEEHDLPFFLGAMLQRISYFPEALAFFEESYRLYGAHPTTLHNIALCYFNMQRLEEALEASNQTLALEPNYPPARAMRISLESALQQGRAKGWEATLTKPMTNGAAADLQPTLKPTGNGAAPEVRFEAKTEARNEAKSASKKAKAPAKSTN